jgi:hypothetical protein
MKKLILIFLVIFAFSAFSQNIPGNFYKHNGEPGQYFGGAPYDRWEETVLLLPPGPGVIEQIHVYLHGSKAGKDTVRITGAPTEGAYPPTIFSAHLNTYAEAILEYDGTPGWRTIDVSSLNIRAGGNNRIAIQHILNNGGPYWAMDTDGIDNSNYSSFINDVFKPNPDFYNIRGTLVRLTPGDYLAGITFNYDYPEGDGSAPKPEPTLKDVTSDAGLPVIRNAMATAVDWNNDGYDDIAIGSRFFQNNQDGTFSEIQLLDEDGGNLGVGMFSSVWGDIDNDGYMDVFAARGNGNDELYFGNPDGTFTQKTSSDIQAVKPTVSPLLFDMDKDGDLDIFVAYGRTSSNGQETYYQDQLYENKGNREFEDITPSSGITQSEKSPYYDCWGATLCDYNNDGLTDVFVATYRLAPDLLYKNNGDGTFTNVAAQNGAQGVPTYYDGYFGHGIGADWGDFDNDGDFDLAVGNLGHPDDRALASNRSLILENTQNGGKFVDNTDEMNLRFLEMNGGIVWVDLNNDSWLDIAHAQISYNGYQDVQANPLIYKPSRYYINQGPENNYYLKDVTWEIGGDIHGAWSPVRLDYNNDGKMDLLMASSLENVKLFENNIEDDQNNWIGFDISGMANSDVNSTGYGTTVKLYAADKMFIRSLPGSVLTGRAAQNSNKIHFGLGDISSVDYAEVTFQNGKTITFNSLEINSYNKLIYDEDLSVNDELYEQTGFRVYPNPVKNNAKVEFYLNDYSNVKLELFDMNGNLLQVIFDGELHKGLQSIDLELDNYSAGAYNISLKNKNILINKKIILHK